MKKSEACLNLFGVFSNKKNTNTRNTLEGAEILFNPDLSEITN